LVPARNVGRNWLSGPPWMLMMTGRLPGNLDVSGAYRKPEISRPSKDFQWISCGWAKVAVLRPAVSDSVQRSMLLLVMSRD